MFILFLSAIAVAFSGAVMPGPLLTYTVKQAFSGGLRSGLTIILGHVLLELLLVVFIFLGFDIILQSGAAQIIIGLVGGALLIDMGVKMLTGAARNTVKLDMQGSASTRGLVASGFLISAMNPYFLLWWAVVGLGFLLTAYQTFGFWGVGVWFAGHILVDFGWYGLISWLIGKTRRFLDERIYRALIGILGGLLVYFGAMFLWNALRSLQVI